MLIYLMARAMRCGATQGRWRVVVTNFLIECLATPPLSICLSTVHHPADQKSNLIDNKKTVCPCRLVVLYFSEDQEKRFFELKNKPNFSYKFFLFFIYLRKSVWLE